jgi:hypothetical protein
VRLQIDGIGWNTAAHTGKENISFASTWPVVDAIVPTATETDYCPIRSAESDSCIQSLDLRQLLRMAKIYR